MCLTNKLVVLGKVDEAGPLNNRTSLLQRRKAIPVRIGSRCQWRLEIKKRANISGDRRQGVFKWGDDSKCGLYLVLGSSWGLIKNSFHRTKLCVCEREGNVRSGQITDNQGEIGSPHI